MSWWDKHKPKKMEEREVKPCEMCKTNRWKTKVKGKRWECRKCGNVRIKEE